MVDWVKECQKNQEIACIETNKTPIEIATGAENKKHVIGWVGDAEWPCFIGYPYLGMNTIRDDQGKVLNRTRFIRELGLGFPLIFLYFDEETHCAVCVRGDVYANN